MNLGLDLIDQRYLPLKERHGDMVSGRGIFRGQWLDCPKATSMSRCERMAMGTKVKRFRLERRYEEKVALTALVYDTWPAMEALQVSEVSRSISEGLISKSRDTRKLAD